MLHPRLAPAKLALGCATFGREIDAASAVAIMEYACERGIHDFDTAPTYGDGASESLVGAWLSAQSSSCPVRVATKVKPPYTADRIRQSVDSSRRRLQRDRIDLLYLHQWDATALDVKVLLTLAELADAGVVGALGASNVTLPQLGDLHRHQSRLGATRFRTIQNNHNFAVRGVDPALAAYCQTHDVEVVTYSPLGAGFLTGKHRQAVQPGSRFDMVPAHQEIYFQPDALRQLDRLTSVAAASGLSSATLALAWALHQPATTRVLIGARSTSHLDQAIAASQLALAPVFAQLS